MRILPRLIFGALLLLSPFGSQSEAEASLSAWDVLLRENSSLLERASELERDVLQLMTPDQVQSFIAGTDPAEMVLLTGESLDAFLIRKGASSFDLSWYTIGDGGGAMAGGDFTLVGAIGQPDAAIMSGGSFSLSGGFLGSEPTPPVDPCTGSDVIFCDGFELGDTAAWSSL